MKKIAAQILFTFLAFAAPLAALSQGAPPNCTDTGGQHLNYTAATHSWSCGTSSSSAMAIGGTVTGGTAGSVLYVGSGPVLSQDNANFKWGTTAGQGLTLGAGTATTDVPAFSVTRTNNNAAVATGVKFTFTDTTSAAGFLPFQVLGGAGGTTNLLSVNKSGNILTPGDLTIGAGGIYSFNNGTAMSSPNGDGTLRLSNAAATDFNRLQFGGTTSSFPAIKRISTDLAARRADDSGYTRFDALDFYAFGNVIGFGGSTTINDTADGVITILNDAGTSFGRLNFGGTTSSFPAIKRSNAELQARVADDSAYANLDALGYKRGGVITISGTAPTIASGGCTGAAISGTPNGTAYFTIDVGTSCSGSQPLVFTLPAAAIGWNCYARNITNGATSAPAQTGSVSTTSVTITNFVRTTGVAGAWTNGDDVVVSCLGG